MPSDYVPEGCPLSPWEDEEDACPECGLPLVPGDPHIYCR